ncbi:MAG: hypothetical protein AAFZ89_07880 [Bacteroidota bacterium]
MKKILCIASLLLAIVYMGSCTNDEGDDGLEILTPTDTLQSATVISNH